MKTVLVVQRRLTHYRVPFFKALREEMALRNLHLVVAHGVPASFEISKRDGGELTWAQHLNTRYFAGERVCWQPFAKLAKRSDLTVATHENKLVCNLGSQYLWRRHRFALWGHGANLQAADPGIRERFKSLTARRADWWFGYTNLSKALIGRTGFPAERTTILNNSIDTSSLARQLASVDGERVSAVREQLGLVGANVGIYIGSLYNEKRIDFLLLAAELIRQQIPDFELVVVGGGPDENKVKARAATREWIRYLGPAKDERKAELMALAKVMLNPGLVGLGILDSFASGIPMVTTDCGLHSPEIAYLETGVNGIMTENEMSSFAAAVVCVLKNEELRSRLSAGCLESASTYTLENMVRNFCAGAEECLEAPLHSQWAGRSAESYT